MGLAHTLHRLNARRRLAKSVVHKPLHHVHHLTHLGYLATLLTENSGLHILSVAALLAIVCTAYCLGDEI